MSHETDDQKIERLSQQCEGLKEERDNFEGALNELREENYRLLQALHEVAVDSEEADVVRTVVAAMCASHRGLSFLQTNPI